MPQQETPGWDEARCRSEIRAARAWWREVALSTTPCDRRLASAHVRRLHRARYPVAWCESPLAGAVRVFEEAAATYPIEGECTTPFVDVHELRRDVWYGLSYERRFAVWRGVHQALDGELRGGIGRDLRRLRDLVVDEIRARLVERVERWDLDKGHPGPRAGREAQEDWLADQGEQRRGLTIDEMWELLEGAFEPVSCAPDLIAWDRLVDCAGTPRPDGLDELVAATAQLGWWWDTSFCTVLTERAVHLSAPIEGQLHRGDGPVARWPDGFAVFSWRGTRVPGDLIDPGWELSRIRGETDLALRQCAIESRGWHRTVAEAGLTQVGQTMYDDRQPRRTLTVHEVPADLWGEPGRVLLRHGVEQDSVDDPEFRPAGMLPPDVVDPVDVLRWERDEPGRRERRARLAEGLG